MSTQNKAKRQVNAQQKSVSHAVSSLLARPVAHNVVAKFLQPNKFVQEASGMALICMNRIANGVGFFDDWNKIMHRLYAGSVAYADYFKPDAGIADAINKAVDSMRLIMVRTHCIGADGFAMRPTEMDRVVDALCVIDTLTRYMLPAEVMSAYERAGMHLDNIMRDNKKASDMYDERQKILQELAQEHQAAPPLNLAA